MITCQFKGGLGNNLFQIAATVGAALENMPEVALFPDWKYNHMLATPLDARGDTPVTSVYEEPHFHYAPIPYTDGMELRGYFQSYRYCPPVPIRRILQPHESIARDLSTPPMRRMFEKAVAVHVRRGDYLTMPEHHPVLPISYYVDAMARFRGFTYLVFSDDIAWCQREFPKVWHLVGGDLVFVSGYEDYEDFYRMAACRHHIIANSAFSWWAARLGEYLDKRVIAPDRWFGPAYASYDTSDLLPKSWEIIGV